MLFGLVGLVGLIGLLGLVGLVRFVALVGLVGLVVLIGLPLPPPPLSLPFPLLVLQLRLLFFQPHDSPTTKTQHEKLKLPTLPPLIQRGKSCSFNLEVVHFQRKWHQKANMWYQHGALMEVIERSLDSTFDGHWGVIGGHWRSLVKNLHKTVHIVADSAHSANNTKTYAKHENIIVQ